MMINLKKSLRKWAVIEGILEKDKYIIQTNIYLKGHFLTATVVSWISKILF